MTSTSTLTHTGRIVGAAAIALAVMVTALGAWFHEADSALAPSVVRVTGDLGNGYRATSAAIYIDTNVKTTVLTWPADPMGGANLPAVGTPCSTTGLLAGQVTTKVIVKSLANRKCQ